MCTALFFCSAARVAWRGVSGSVAYMQAVCRQTSPPLVDEDLASMLIERERLEQDAGTLAQAVKKGVEALSAEVASHKQRQRNLGGMLDELRRARAAVAALTENQSNPFN